MEADPLTILTGDAIAQLRTLPDESVQMCCTSPPYWGLRDYSTNGQLGLEKTPEEYVAKMVEVFREVRRVLRRDGTLWLNLGDSYSSGGRGSYDSTLVSKTSGVANHSAGGTRSTPDWAKPKDLLGIPWRVAFALQADGWWLRSDIIWAKPNPMPESVTDRPTKAHEYLFLLTKSASYFYDAEAIKEKGSSTEYDMHQRQPGRMNGTRYMAEGKGQEVMGDSFGIGSTSRNKRSVWTVATAPYPEAHFATYPPDLIKPCIMAGTSAKGCCAKCGAPWERIVEKGERVWDETENVRPTAGFNKSIDADNNYKSANFWKSGYRPNMHYENKTLNWAPNCVCGPESVPCTVLDPFAGSGTTGAVALELGRKAVLIELNPAYVELIKRRCDVTVGLALA